MDKSSNDRTILKYKSKVFVLSGFLGAGKTTLLKQILSWQEDLSETVVIVNEFGDVGIDGALLKGIATDVIELTNGCICCTISLDLRQTLANTVERFKPRRIFIEASGVADPTAIVTVLNSEALREYIQLEKIVTILDSILWEARETFGRLFYNQLENANLVLLNKIDQLEKNKVGKYLQQIHELIPGSQVVPTIQCRLDPEIFWLKANHKKLEVKPKHFISTHNHEVLHNKAVTADEGHFQAFTFKEIRPLIEVCFQKFIANLPFEVFRLKGPVRFETGTQLINFVGGKFQFMPWEGDAITHLSFVGWDVDHKSVLKRLLRCVVMD